MPNRTNHLRRFWVMIAVVATLFTVVSFTWLDSRIGLLTQNQVLEQARSYADLIVATRSWNAAHGGVYVQKSDRALTNPYLSQLGIQPDDTLERSGTPVTLRNPSVMTREIGEILPRVGTIAAFRLTSDKPVNPSNAPDEWERAALESFQLGSMEQSGSTVTSDGVAAFRYARPLVTEEDCLGCHGAAGYELGDIRGALIVTLPYQGTLDAIALNRRELTGAGVAMVLVFLVIAGTSAIWLERRLAESARELEEMANTDVLTGLPNRRAALSVLDQEVDRARRTGEQLGIAVIDIDHFKRFNDTYGHATGDEVLRAAASLILGSVRTYDTVGRIGGEELLVIAPSIDAGSLATLGERIRARAASTDLADVCGEGCGALTLSVGTALTTPAGDETLDELVARADRAMYVAKEAGRNRVVAGLGWRTRNRYSY